MSYEALEKLTPSSRGNATSALVPKWIEAIKDEGYTQVEVYHNVKKSENDIKSMVVRKLLGKTFPTLYFVHAKDDDGQIFLIVSNTKKVFNAMKWDYQTYEAESE